MGGGGGWRGDDITGINGITGIGRRGGRAFHTTLISICHYGRILPVHIIIMGFMHMTSDENVM